MNNKCIQSIIVIIYWFTFSRHIEGETTYRMYEIFMFFDISD